MKAAQTLATTALLCALPTSIDALAKVETRNLDAVEDDPSRGLMHVVSNFDNIAFSLFRGNLGHFVNDLAVRVSVSVSWPPLMEDVVYNIIIIHGDA